MHYWDWILLTGGIVPFLLGLVFILRTLLGKSTRGIIHARISAGVGILLNTTFLAIQAVRNEYLPVTNLFEFTFLFANLLMILAILIDLVRKMPAITIAATPLSTIFLFTALLLATAPGEHSQKATSLWSVTHVLISLGAFGAFAFSFIGGILYLIEQQQLKGRPRPDMIGMMPSLQTLNNLIRVAIATGIVFLTIGGVIGYLYARTTELQGNSWRTDPKILLTTITWAAYGILFFASMRPLFRGRKTAWASIACFGLLVFTAWSTVFWSPFHNYL